MTDHHPCAQLHSCAKYYIDAVSKDQSNTTYCVISLMFTAFSGEAFLNDHLLDLWNEPKSQKKLVGVSVKKWDEIERRRVMQKYGLLVDYFNVSDVEERGHLKELFDLRNRLAHPKVTASELKDGTVPEVVDPFKEAFTFEIVKRHFDVMGKFMERLDQVAGRRFPTNRFVSGLR